MTPIPRSILEPKGLADPPLDLCEVAIREAAGPVADESGAEGGKLGSHPGGGKEIGAPPVSQGVVERRVAGHLSRTP